MLKIEETEIHMAVLTSLVAWAATHGPTHLYGHLLVLVITSSTEPIVKDLQVEGAVLSDHASIMFNLFCLSPWRSGSVRDSLSLL